jgi:hypothetical protein
VLGYLNDVWIARADICNRMIATPNDYVYCKFPLNESHAMIIADEYSVNAMTRFEFGVAHDDDEDYENPHNTFGGTQMGLHHYQYMKLSFFVNGFSIIIKSDIIMLFYSLCGCHTSTIVSSIWPSHC